MRGRQTVGLIVLFCFVFWDIWQWMEEKWDITQGSSKTVERICCFHFLRFEAEIFLLLAKPPRFITAMNALSPPLTLMHTCPADRDLYQWSKQNFIVFCNWNDCCPNDNFLLQWEKNFKNQFLIYCLLQWLSSSENKLACQFWQLLC